ncbi:PREDICTED: uncharacterized protein LOC108760545 [Trachymyrmex cornetzi]|uniref:uncharacterized protein LOC108760545 n=1 Tax=Trachymyrmex cornetzi TaxID=471704 RepID=UPI00084F7030|nr:PREDICTED: uncharacterized protein LOC108760545 [Trachymyrmex cornetzi]
MADLVEEMGKVKWGEMNLGEQVRTRRKGRSNAFSRAKQFEPAGIMLLLALRNSVNGTQSVSMNNQQFGFKIMCRYHIERETPRET